MMLNLLGDDTERRSLSVRRDRLPPGVRAYELLIRRSFLNVTSRLSVEISKTENVAPIDSGYTRVLCTKNRVQTEFVGDKFTLGNGFQFSYQSVNCLFKY